MRRVWTIVAFVGGCSPTILYSPLQSPPHPVDAIPSSIVQVLKREPAQAYLTIGLIESHPGSGFGLPPDPLEQMRTEAARHGCDAILLHPVLPTGRAGTIYRAGCIVYTIDTTRDGAHGE
jgi:hypothetical protein